MRFKIDLGSNLFVMYNSEKRRSRGNPQYCTRKRPVNLRCPRATRRVFRDRDGEIYPNGHLAPPNGGDYVQRYLQPVIFCEYRCYSLNLAAHGGIAQVDIAQMIRELDAEISRLTSARRILAGSNSSAGPKQHPKATSAVRPSTKRRRSRLSPEGRKRLSEMMKKRWVERRRKATGRPSSLARSLPCFVRLDTSPRCSSRGARWSPPVPRQPISPSLRSRQLPKPSHFRRSEDDGCGLSS